MTGHEVPATGEFRRDVTWFDDICGRWGVTAEAEWGEANVAGGRLYTERGQLNEAETKRVLALARSEVWRLNNLHKKVPLFMTLKGSGQRSAPRDDQSVILTLEDLHDAALQLTLERKASMTLENLIFAEGEIGAGVEVPYYLSEYPGEPAWSGTELPKEIGITYGCTAVEAAMAYQFLKSRGWIVVRAPRTQGSPTTVFVTPDGYAKGERLRTGTDRIRQQAFLVCRFIPEIDSLFDGVIRPLGVELGCAVQRIKDIHHIDKIDDRICQEIARSSIVLVDLTEQNFNVAFEAGYALALNKPIVWTARREAEGVKMPFDIYTYNCLEWDPTDLSAFSANLKFRMMAALQKADRDRGPA